MITNRTTGKPFSLSELTRIMNDFGSKPRIFNSEAQFQHELAWKIKDEFNCDVFLEQMTLEKTLSKKTVKRDYTDIVLQKDGYRVALELKYKTEELPSYYLCRQDAVDLGCFDFMLDVNRLELLVHHAKKIATEPNKQIEYKFTEKPFNEAYAIILTNEPMYWNGPKNHSVIYNEFRISGHPSGMLTKGIHDWKKTAGVYPKTVLGTSRARSIELLKDYPYEWQQYCSLKAKNGEFKYMIINVK